jgi:hypothetical protein
MTEGGKGCVTKCIGSDMPAKVGKHGSYRRNGYHEIVTTPSKCEIYNRSFSRAKQRFKKQPPPPESEHGTGVSVTRTDPSDPANRGAWEIGNPAYPKNFTKGHIPYNHDYHHIMPMDCILSLGTANLKLLMEEEYNLNAGINLIILPKTEYFARQVQLPYHCDDHPEYLEAVKKEIEKVRRKMVRAKKVHRKEQVKKVKDALERWEKRMFTKIKELGVAEVARNKKAPDIATAKPGRISL